MEQTRFRGESAVAEHHSASLGRGGARAAARVSARSTALKGAPELYNSATASTSSLHSVIYDEAVRISAKCHHRLGKQLGVLHDHIARATLGSRLHATISFSIWQRPGRLIMRVVCRSLRLMTRDELTMEDSEEQDGSAWVQPRFPSTIRTWTLFSHARFNGH